MMNLQSYQATSCGLELYEMVSLGFMVTLKPSETVKGRYYLAASIGQDIASFHGTFDDVLQWACAWCLAYCKKGGEFHDQ